MSCEVSAESTAVVWGMPRSVVEAGHGQYFRPRAGEVGIEQVRRAIGNLRRAEIAASQQTVYDELVGWFLAPAFLLLAVGTMFVPERIGALMAPAPKPTKKRKTKRGARARRGLTP